jgi:hypothetical protein
MTSSFPTVGQRLTELTLSRRLDALAELIRIGRARPSRGEDQAQGPGEEAVVSVAMRDFGDYPTNRRNNHRGRD